MDFREQLRLISSLGDTNDFESSLSSQLKDIGFGVLGHPTDQPDFIGAFGDSSTSLPYFLGNLGLGIVGYPSFGEIELGKSFQETVEAINASLRASAPVPILDSNASIEVDLNKLNKMNIIATSLPKKGKGFSFSTAIALLSFLTATFLTLYQIISNNIQQAENNEWHRLLYQAQLKTNDTLEEISVKIDQDFKTKEELLETQAATLELMKDISEQMLALQQSLRPEP